MLSDIRKIRLLTSEPEALLIYIKSLSNSQFRNASKLLGEQILKDVSVDDFWKIFKTLFLHDRKAYLGTLLKALVQRLCVKAPLLGERDLETSGIWNSDFAELCREMNDTDRRKLLVTLLPLFSSPVDVERLLLQCGLREYVDWIPYLLQVQSMPCAYLLLKALRYVENDRALLIRTCHFLMKRGDSQSFNLASLLRLSFGLEEVRGTFSLSLEPYQLSRVEQNYDAFVQVMTF
jgi:hypothetical protein